MPEDKHQHSRGRLSVFRWDINIRESTILGLVGAGGIGLQLQASLNVLAGPQVAVILIAIFISVLVSEWVSAKVRHAIICPPDQRRLSATTAATAKPIPAQFLRDMRSRQSPTPISVPSNITETECRL